MVENPKFDVFLAHNSVDKPQVRAIAEELKKRGLKPWLDEEQIPPGRSFQQEIQQAIPLVKSAAIFIGSEGLGKWQLLELQTLISQLINQGIPVIPVLLPGVDKIPDGLLFLQNFNWVSFENIDDDAAFYKLEWGIKRVKPKLSQLLKVFEFDVVLIDVQQSKEVQRSGLFGLKEEVKISSNISLNRSHSQAQYFTEDLGNNITLDMVAIPDGKFIMGSPEGEGYKDEKPQHEVTVHPFFMGKYPITQAQWKAIASLPKVERDLDSNPARFKDREDSDRRPIEKVSWEDAVEFCQRLSQQTGKTYRLPTEAEWEYACRSVISHQSSVISEELTVEEWNEKYNQPFHFGETISTNLANYRGTDWEYQGKVYPGNYGKGLKGIFRGQTTPVGSFPPNAFGLYDMHGNVWEWCADNWQENYEGAPTDGSAWLTGSSSKKVVRSGSWINLPHNCRSAIRDSNTRVNRNDSIGVRVVCVAPRTT